MNPNALNELRKVMSEIKGQLASPGFLTEAQKSHVVELADQAWQRFEHWTEEEL